MPHARGIAGAEFSPSAELTRRPVFGLSAERTDAARIVVVHDDPDFREGAVTALAAAGYDIALFTGSMEAIGAFEVAERIELLITRVVFPEGTPTGVSLTRMAKVKNWESASCSPRATKTASIPKGSGNFCRCR